jgi:photosystem II stability/assembly factor-like uncharacterized protein
MKASAKDAFTFGKSPPQRCYRTDSVNDRRSNMKRDFIACFVLLSILLCADGATITRAQDNVWTGTGPEGAQVRKLVADHANPAILYAGTVDKGVLKSVDGGASWNAINNGLSSTDVLSLALDPANSKTLYTGTNDHGLFKSTDGGANWFSIKAGLPPDYAVTSIVINTITPSTLYVGTIGDCGFFTCKGQVYKSVDGGSMWTATGNVVQPNGGILALALDPKDPKNIYAASSEFGDLYKSTDGGVSWELDFASTFPTIVTIVIDPITPSTIYVGTSGLVIIPSQRRIFKGIYKSTDGGGSWKEKTAGLLDTNVEAIAIDPRTPTTLYVATGSGVFRSGNGGDNWSELSMGLTNLFVSDLAIATADQPTLYAGTNGGVFVVQPVGPLPPPVLRITGAFQYKANLYVFGEKFEDGAKILLNGEKQKTKNAFYNPTATLISSKAAKRISRGRTVSLQVRNPDGSLSPEFTFMR